MAKKDVKNTNKNNKKKTHDALEATQLEAASTDGLPPANLESEAQQYLVKMQTERGYILDWHKVLAENDFEFLKGYNSLLEAAYTNPRSLDVKTKEMVITAVLMAVRSQPLHIKTHLELCKKFGVTAQEMLEVLEVVLPPAGVPAFMHSFDIWRQVYEIK